jgi:PAS domain S-box-containing protein
VTVNYRLVFEATPHPMAIISAEGHVVMAVNDAFLRVSLTTREQLIGRCHFDLFPESPDVGADGVENLRESFRRVVEWGRPDLMAVQRWDVLRPDGTWEKRYWRPLNVPVLEGEAVVFIIHAVEDVTAVVAVTGRKEMA